MNTKEIAMQEARIAKLAAAGEDEYTLKKQAEVLDECTMMVPQTQSKLEAAHDELAAALVRRAPLFSGASVSHPAFSAGELRGSGGKRGVQGRRGDVGFRISGSVMPLD